MEFPSRPLLPKERKQRDAIFADLKKRLGVSCPLSKDDEPHPKVVVEIRKCLEVWRSEVGRRRSNDPLLGDIDSVLKALENVPEEARPEQIKAALDTHLGKNYFDPK